MVCHHDRETGLPFNALSRVSRGQRQLFVVAILFRVGDTAAVAKHEGVATVLRPVVLMHGLDANSESMSHMQGWIEADFPGIHVHNAEVGNGKMSSWFMPIDKQVEAFAASVRSDDNLKQGFNLIGHSQGGMISRAYIERFNDPPVHNFITLSSPHDGVFGVPDFNAICPDRDCPWLDDIFSELLEGNAGALQDHVSFAAYWHDPINYTDWLKTNKFLTDINNLKAEKNRAYKDNIASLNAWLQLYSTVDAIVIPKTSPVFSFYADGSDKVLVPMRETTGYLEDWIGLRTLDTSGRLQQRSCNCSHGDEPREDCKWTYDAWIVPLLNNTM